MSKSAENFLSTMATSSLARYLNSSSILSENKLLDLCQKIQSNEPLVFNKESFCLIAEIKKTSPSSGKLSPNDFNIQQQTNHYINGKADIISVLTEPSRFAGSLQDLSELSTTYPETAFMRKDFLVHPYQVSEALYYGARGVLLITGILNEEQLADMIKRALEHNMFVLIEAFNKEELNLSRAVISQFKDAQDSLMLGINCRDLKTLEVSFSRFKALSEYLPQEGLCIAESGIFNTNDISQIVDWGYSGALVGTALMQTNNPENTLLEFRQVAEESKKHV